MRRSSMPHAARTCASASRMFAAVIPRSRLFLMANAAALAGLTSLALLLVPWPAGPAGLACWTLAVPVAPLVLFGPASLGAITAVGRAAALGLTIATVSVPVLEPPTDLRVTTLFGDKREVPGGAGLGSFTVWTGAGDSSLRTTSTPTSTSADASTPGVVVPGCGGLTVATRGVGTRVTAASVVDTTVLTPVSGVGGEAARAAGSMTMTGSDPASSAPTTGASAIGPLTTVRGLVCGDWGTSPGVAGCTLTGSLLCLERTIRFRPAAGQTVAIAAMQTADSNKPHVTAMGRAARRVDGIPSLSGARSDDDMMLPVRIR